MKKETNKPDAARTKPQVDRYVKFFLYGIIIVLVNVIGVFGLFRRCDITDGGVYSISQASKDVIRSLNEPLSVRVFISKNLDYPYTDLAPFIEDLLKEYKEAGNKYFSYQVYDVGGSENESDKSVGENRQLAQDYGINPEQIESFANDQATFKRVYKGIAIVHGDMIEQITNVEKQRLEYRITTTIKKMSDKISVLLGLKDKIKVKLFLSSGLYAKGKEVNTIPDKIKEAVDKLNKENYNKLEFTHLDPSANPQFQKDAEGYNLFHIPSAENGGEKLFVSIVVEYGDKTSTIDIIERFNTPWGVQYQFADMEAVKEQMKDTVSSIIDVNQKIGYLGDHGTVFLSVPEFMQQDPETAKNAATVFNRVVSENYSVKEINLKDQAIPSGLDTLIIAGPKESFTDWELFQIDQFLMQGKSLAIFYDGIKVEKPEQNPQMYGYQPPPRFDPVNTGLEFLLEHYGVQVANSYVFDDNSYEQHDKRYGDIKLFYVPSIQNENINDDLPFMRNLKGMLAIQASPLRLVEENLKTNNAKATVLFSSSNKSWEVSENISIDPFQPPPPAPEDSKKSHPLAYVIEGEFTSYFKGKPLPEPPVKERAEAVTSGITSKDLSIKDTYIEKGKKGKLFITGSSEIMKDMILEGVGPNQIFVANVLDYLNGRTDYAVMRAKTQTINPLDKDKTTAVAKNVTKYFNIIVLPLIVGGVGIFMFLRRQARKRMIQSRFVKQA